MGRDLNLQWVQVGAGKLALRGRPGVKALPQLKAAGCTHVVTLLSAKEGGDQLGEQIKAQGITWTWLPLAGADTPDEKAAQMLAAAFPVLSNALDQGDAILIHFAAGIHRTGMITYALLRYRGCSAEEARALILQLRDHTANGMLPHHFAWGDALFD